jgi:hemerythrin-like domain-containing protein
MTMEAIELLTRSHSPIRNALDQISNAMNSDERSWAIHRLHSELFYYTELEEELLLPALEKHEILRSESINCRTVNAELRLLADKLLTKKWGDKTFTRDYERLSQLTQHHFQKEESHLYPLANQILNSAEKESMNAKADGIRTPGRAVA